MRPEVLMFSFGEKTLSNDFKIITNSNNKFSEIDVLIFLDSRGQKSNDDNTETLLTQLYNHYASHGSSVLAISRPYASTTFASLINVVNENKIQAKELITNVGFVDFTPKKIEIIEDVLSQCIQAGLMETRVIDLNDQLESDNKRIELFTIDYGDSCKQIKMFLKKYRKVVLFGTNEINSSVQFPRHRPCSFYTQLIKTNKFLRELIDKDIMMLDAIELSSEEVVRFIYDGVHFSRDYHLNFFNNFKKVVG